MPTTPNTLTAEDRTKIIRFLKTHPVAVLATTSEQGKPHASIIYVNVDDHLTITFTTKRETTKYKNIARDSNIMLVVYEAQNQSILQVQGKAVEVTDPAEQRAIYQGTLHATKQTGDDEVPPIAKISAGSYVGFRVEIEDIQLTTYGWHSSFAKAIRHTNDPHSTGDPA